MLKLLDVFFSLNSFVKCATKCIIFFLPSVEIVAVNIKLLNLFVKGKYLDHDALFRKSMF
jgi:hypothetical protein